jgi:hypothetical protein
MWLRRVKFEAASLPKAEKNPEWMIVTDHHDNVLVAG